MTRTDDSPETAEAAAEEDAEALQTDLDNADQELGKLSDFWFEDDDDTDDDEYDD